MWVLVLPFLVGTMNFGSDVVPTTAQKVNIRTHEEVRLEYKTRVEEAREAQEQRRVEFREKLERIKNEHKRKAVERLNTRLNTINARWVEQWSGALERLTNILDKFEERSGETYSSARAAIATAQEAVNAQAGKVHEIAIDTEDNLGEVTGSAIATLREDMKLVWTSVNAAREAVMEVVQNYTNE